MRLHATRGVHPGYVVCVDLWLIYFWIQFRINLEAILVECV